MNTTTQYVLLAWPIVTALASLGYTALDKTSRGHAVLSFLASLGIDLPKVLDALRRIFAGGPPGASQGGPSHQDPFYPAPPATPRNIRSGTFEIGQIVLALVVVWALVFAAISLAACGASKSTIRTVTDTTGAICSFVVTAADPALAPLCTTAQALADAIEAVVGSGGDAGVGAAQTAKALDAAHYEVTPAVYGYLVAHGAAVGR